MSSYRVGDGLAELGPGLLALQAALERRVLSWAEALGAEPRRYPPLVRAADLAAVDYFENFPHLALVASGIQRERLEGYVAPADGIPGEHLAPSDLLLPSAACYAAWFSLRGRRLDGLTGLTMVANCFRNEASYDGLRRLRSFTMREIVFAGDADAVRERLTLLRERLAALAGALGLATRFEVATDPFFQPDGPRALLQRLFPTKEELLTDDGLAISSVNFHRNFFGERCDIRGPDGAPVFTGCVAFGVERWLHALDARFQGDHAAAAAALDAGGA